MGAISEITESHENQKNSPSKLEQSRKKFSEVVSQSEATLFSSEKTQTILDECMEKRNSPTGYSSEKIQTILDECIEKRVSPSVLALKYNVYVSTIRDWIKKSGRSLQLGRYLV